MSFWDKLLELVLRVLRIVSPSADETLRKLEKQRADDAEAKLKDQEVRHAAVRNLEQKRLEMERDWDRRGASLDDRMDELLGGPESANGGSPVPSGGATGKPPGQNRKK